jgi:aminoglycoside phosphotransferase (APT) family kinase protein
VLYSEEAVQTIAERHGLKGRVRPLPRSGEVNEAWTIGDDFVLRIGRLEEADAEVEREEAIVPFLIKNGVPTPELVAVGKEKEIVPRAYTIYRMARGSLLGKLEPSFSELPGAYRELGRHLAHVNRLQVPPEIVSCLRTGGWLNARDQWQKAVEKNVVEPAEADEIAAWLSRLEELGGEPPEPAYVHADIHPWNVFVDPAADRLTAIIDWGDCRLGDPAVEFASMPLLSLDAMRVGYREGGGEADEAFFARALHIGLALSLWEMRVLDPVIYPRYWWRTPPEGWPAIKRYIEGRI